MSTLTQETMLQLTSHATKAKHKTPHVNKSHFIGYKKFYTLSIFTSDFQAKQRAMALILRRQGLPPLTVRHSVTAFKTAGLLAASY